MNNAILVGIGSGLAAGLLFAAPAVSSTIIVPFLLINHLPIAIAGLGWGSVAGAVAAGAGTLVAAALGGLGQAFVFLIYFGLPAAWLTHLIGLARPADPVSQPNTLIWYPLGRVLVHATAIVALVSGAVAIAIKANEAAIIDGFTQMWTALIAQTGETELAPEVKSAIESQVNFGVAMMPVYIPVIWLGMIVLNLWLAAKIVRRSGRLARPWEDLSAITVPDRIAYILAISLAFVLFGGPVSAPAAAVLGATGCLFLLIGLAVLHALTRGSSVRPMILWVTYLLIVFMPITQVLVAILGVIETFIKLRARQQPPAAPRT